MKNNKFLVSLLIFLCQAFSAFPVYAQLKTEGPFQVSTGEYRFDAAVDTDILKDRKTEIWARVFWPKSKTDGTIPENLPLVALLHGNHGTCGTGVDPRIDDGTDYTDSGECPSGSVVTPNHEGYNYFAEQLASFGYLVISINANRGITAADGVTGDSGLNLARGRLVLKHLALWSNWSTLGQAPKTLEVDDDSFIGKVNLAHVGLFGHSRGGEGVRAAYNLYYDLGSFWPTKIPNLNIEAIFEIGAVDGQTSRTLDAQNTVWNQLIPVCDGDVSDFEGIRPYNRMVQTAGQSGSGQKSIYLVYGANHNFFNTEWQENDSGGCNYHNPLWGKNDWKSERQQDIAKKIVPDFFRANLGVSKLKKLNNALNPISAIESSIAAITHIERDFSPNPNLDTQLRFDDFIAISKVARESTSDITFIMQKGSNALSSTLNLNWKKENPTDEPIMKIHQEIPVDVTNMKTLDFRFSLPGNRNIKVPVNFSVSLVDDTGKESTSIFLTDYALKSFNSFYSTLYQTVRVPMDKFSGINLAKLKTVQFKFLEPDAGNVYFAHIRFSSMVSDLMFFEDTVSGLPLSPNYKINPDSAVEEISRFVTHAAELNQIVQVQVLPQTNLIETQVAITFASPAPFKIRNALPVLKIGDYSFRLSRIKNDGEKSKIIFYLTLSDLEKIKKVHGDFKITYKGHSFEEWIFTNTLNQ
jgi:hypothetical protein